MKTALLSFAACVAAAAPARAGEAACWYEGGVVVVAAEVAGVVGDFILDTGQAATQLAETQAQSAGYTATAVTGDVRLAGITVPNLPIVVADLDVRTGLLPTPIAGIIGLDVLEDLVLDVGFAPCRIALNRPAHAPAFRAGETLRLEPTPAGTLAVHASVSDGLEARGASLVPATGSDAPARLSETLAGAPVGERPEELFPYGVRRPRLRALSLAGQLWEEVPAGLLKAEAGVDGWIGAPVLARFRLRFDFPRGRLHLARP